MTSSPCGGPARARPLSGEACGDTTRSCPSATRRTSSRSARGHAPPRRPGPWPGPRRAAPPPQVRGGQSDGHHQGPLVSHRRRRRAGVRVPRHLVVSTGNVGPRSPATRPGPACGRSSSLEQARPKLAHMSLVASDLVLYRGFYDDLIRIWDRMIAEQPVFDGGASRNMFKQEGKKTLAWEIAEGCGYRCRTSSSTRWPSGRRSSPAGARSARCARSVASGAPAPGSRAIGEGEPIATAWREDRIFGRYPSATPSPRGLRLATPARRARGAAPPPGWPRSRDRRRGRGRPRHAASPGPDRGALRWTDGGCDARGHAPASGRGALDPASTICCVITETGLKSETRVESRTGETLTYDGSSRSSGSASRFPDPGRSHAAATRGYRK